MKANMAKHIQELKEEQIMSIQEFIKKVSATAYSIEASVKIIKSDLNAMYQTVSKHDHQLNKEQDIYIEQQKAINSCITKAESHVQNNNAIISNLDEKLNKAILNTEQ
eukprot:15331112-Ditylum_brightwellii.AAC.1